MSLAAAEGQHNVAAELAKQLQTLDQEIAPLLVDLKAHIALEPERFDELALILQELIAQRQGLTKHWLGLEAGIAEEGQWLQESLVNTQKYAGQVAELKQFFLEAMHAMKANRTKVDLYKTVESKR
ncbi:MAG: hypothetical protein ACRDBI_07425 [Shewanella sp.]